MGVFETGKWPVVVARGARHLIVGADPRAVRPVGVCTWYVVLGA